MDEGAADVHAGAGDDLEVLGLGDGANVVGDEHGPEQRVSNVVGLGLIIDKCDDVLHDGGADKLAAVRDELEEARPQDGRPERVPKPADQGGLLPPVALECKLLGPLLLKQLKVRLVREMGWDGGSAGCQLRSSAVPCSRHDVAMTRRERHPGGKPGENF